MRSLSCESIVILLFAAFCFMLLFSGSQARGCRPQQLNLESDEVFEISGLRANERMQILLFSPACRRLGKIQIRWQSGRQSIAVFRERNQISARRSCEVLQSGDKATILLQKLNGNLYVFVKDKHNTPILNSPRLRFSYGGVSRIRTISSDPNVRFTTAKKNITNVVRGLGLFQSCGNILERTEVEKSLCNVTESQRIVGGTPAAAGDVPWQVAILEKETERSASSSHVCGGVLIGECAVLTAGHCFFYPKPTYYQVRVGDYYNRDDPRGLFTIYESPQTFEVERIVKHDRYRSQKSTTIASPVNDITLLALKKDATTQNCVTIGRFVQPACIQWPGTKINKKGCRISGWGAREYGESFNKYTSCLLFAEVTIWNETDCTSPGLYKFGTITPATMFCANGYNEKRQITDTCQGDSGGPFICDNSDKKGTLVGVTSFGDKCGGPKPGVYTKVEAYTPWLANKLLGSDVFRSANEIRSTGVSTGMRELKKCNL